MVSLVIAAEDEALSTHYHLRNIMKQTTDSKCRICYKAEEHINTHYCRMHNSCAI